MLNSIFLIEINLITKLNYKNNNRNKGSIKVVWAEWWRVKRSGASKTFRGILCQKVVWRCWMNHHFRKWVGGTVLLYDCTVLRKYHNNYNLLRPLRLVYHWVPPSPSRQRILPHSSPRSPRDAPTRSHTTYLMLLELLLYYHNFIQIQSAPDWPSHLNHS